MGSNLGFGSHSLKKNTGYGQSGDFAFHDLRNRKMNHIAAHLNAVIIIVVRVKPQLYRLSFPDLLGFQSPSVPALRQFSVNLVKRRKKTISPPGGSNDDDVVLCAIIPCYCGTLLSLKITTLLFKCTVQRHLSFYQ